MTDRSDDWQDEFHAERHRRFLQAKLRRLPPGHPDEPDLIDALNPQEEPDEPARPTGD